MEEEKEVEEEKKKLMEGKEKQEGKLGEWEGEEKK